MLSAWGSRHKTGSYVARRLAMFPFLLFAVSVLTFLLIRLGKENPAALIAGPTATKQQVLAVQQSLGLNSSLFVQYWHYLDSALHGNFGNSWIAQESVSAVIRQRLPSTIVLWFLGMIGAVVGGVTLGTVSAVRKDRPSDHIIRGVTLVGLSIPIFLIGLVLIYVFYFVFHLAPEPFGQIGNAVSSPRNITGSDFLDSILTGNFSALGSASAQLALPVLSIAFVTGATIAKQTRTAVVNTLHSPAVRFARACGFSNRQLVWLQLRNAAPTIITYVGLASTAALGGSALVELVFSWGGLGEFALDAIVKADFAVVQAYVFVVAVITITIYLLTDLAVGLVDPRVSYK